MSRGDSIRIITYACVYPDEVWIDDGIFDIGVSTVDRIGRGHPKDVR